MEQNHSLGFNNGTPWHTTCTLELDNNVRRVVLFLLFLLIFITGLLGNLLVLWVNWSQRHSANGVLFCVINVSLSDMMVIFILPFYMMAVTIGGVWLWGRFLCKMNHLIYSVNCYSSSFFLALMTLERYLSLTKPAFPSLFPEVGRRRWWLCGGVWLLSFILALFENVHVDLPEWDEPGCFLLPEQNHMEWYLSIAFLNFIFQFLGPSAVIVVCNVLIARAMRTAPDVQDKSDVWLVHVYSLVFVLCWLPYHFVILIIEIDSLTYDIIFSCNFMDMLYFSYEIVELFSLFHCVANPILYNFLSKSFRGNLMDKVMTYINKEGNVAQIEAGTRPNGRGRAISSASTSHSDVEP